MSDVDVMAAIIEKHAETFFRNQQYVKGGYRVSSVSALDAAQALHDSGFRMGAGATDERQNARLDALEVAVRRLEGWSGLP